MADKSGQMFEMPKRASLAADLFTTQAQRDDAKLERVRELPLFEISDFPNHPFKVRLDEEMQEMAESVKQYGVLVPCLGAPKRAAAMKWWQATAAKKPANWQGAIPCPSLSVSLSCYAALRLSCTWRLL